MHLRYGLRSLARTPGFTAVAALTLALGLGINTIVFTLYESVVWKPLAVRSPGEMVRLDGRLAHGQAVDEFSYADYQQIRAESRSFDSVVATSLPQGLLCVLPGGKPEDAEVAQARLVSENYFAALGVKLAAGRAFEEGEPGVVVSHSFWRTRLGGDAAVVGRELTLQGVPVTILGVAAEEFAGTGLPPRSPDLWVPLSLQTRVLPVADWLHDGNVRPLQLLARRRAEVPLERASAEVATLGARLPLIDNQALQLRARAATYFQTDSGEFETFVTISRLLMVAVALILLIGCVNLVNLLMARGAARERELAVRRALGAARWQLIRQLSTESLLLGLAGGASGFLLSTWASAWLSASLIATVHRVTGGMLGLSLDVSPDWRVFAYTALLSAATGIAVGIWPAVRASQVDINAALKGQGSTGGRPIRGRLSRRNLLLTAQVAACLILLAGAGLLFRGVWRSRGTDPGFDARHMLLLGVDPAVVASTPASRAALLHRVVDRLNQLPQIASVAMADRPPFLGHATGDILKDRRDVVSFNKITERYFDTLGIPMVAGRAFTQAEAEAEEPVVVVNEAAAKSFWPGENPLGRRVELGDWTKGIAPHSSYTVIGVAKTVRSTYLSKDDAAAFYFPRPLVTSYNLLLVRTRTAPERALRPAVAALAAIDPSLPARSSVVTLEQGSMEIQRMMAQAPAVVSSALGLLALILAAVGIYGVVSYLVAQRTREIGIRVVLGARPGDVVRMVLREGLTSVAWGAAAGLIGALALSTLLAKLLAAPDVPDLTYGAGAFDAATFLGVLAVLTAVVLAASLLPVRRATRVEPIVALREE